MIVYEWIRERLRCQLFLLWFELKREYMCQVKAWLISNLPKPWFAQAVYSPTLSG